MTHQYALYDDYKKLGKANKEIDDLITSFVADVRDWQERHREAGSYDGEVVESIVHLVQEELA